MAGRFEVTVTRVGEAEHEADDFTVQADTISVEKDGSLKITWEGGGQSLSPTSWGWFEVTRVKSAKRRGV